MNFLASQISFGPKFLLDPIFLDTTFFWTPTKISFWPNFVWQNTFFLTSNSFWTWYDFYTNNCFVLRVFFDPKYFVTKLFRTPNWNWNPTFSFFWPKIFSNPTFWDPKLSWSPMFSWPKHKYIFFKIRNLIKFDFFIKMFKRMLEISFILRIVVSCKLRSLHTF